jgi:uncharacterized protein YjbI with pentapeptide repeats
MTGKLDKEQSRLQRKLFWEKHRPFRGKTLWDWLQLLIIPTVLAAGALWFDQSQQVRTEAAEATRISEQRAVEATRAGEQQRIETDRAQEQNLQSYYDDLTDLLLKYNLGEEMKWSQVKTTARARTLTTLRTLDSTRKGLLIQFLIETSVVSAADNSMSLSGADLSNASLGWYDLKEVELRWVDLSWADLTGAELIGADLTGADLTGANLTGADLTETDLTWAILDGAVLVGANLSKANLTEASFGGADLTNAVLTLEQLALSAFLENAIMPDGKKYDPALHILPIPTPKP